MNGGHSYDAVKEPEPTPLSPPGDRLYPAVVAPATAPHMSRFNQVTETKEVKEIKDVKDKHVSSVHLANEVSPQPIAANLARKAKALLDDAIATNTIEQQQRTQACKNEAVYLKRQIVFFPRELSSICFGTKIPRK